MLHTWHRIKPLDICPSLLQSKRKTPWKQLTMVMRCLLTECEPFMLALITWMMSKQASASFLGTLAAHRSTGTDWCSCLHPILRLLLREGRAKSLLYSYSQQLAINTYTLHQPSEETPHCVDFHTFPRHSNPHTRSYQQRSALEFIFHFLLLLLL